MSLRDEAPSLGLQTFAEVSDLDGVRTSHGVVLREAVEAGVLADEVGLEHFTVGEHHRADLPVPVPEVVLAAVAARTRRVHLGSAVTVLSTDDPVRVYERFAMLDAISGGRAEPMLGRGSFTESFALYGVDLADYEELFEERLHLWSLLRAEGPVTWSGRTRPPLHGAEVFPRSETPGGLTTWVGVGGSPRSVVRAAAYGFHLMLAGLGMTPERIAASVDLFDRALAARGTGSPRPRVGLSVTGFLADTDREARDLAWEPYRARMARIGLERGFAAPTRRSYEESIDGGLNLIGSPETVAQRIGDLLDRVHLDRIDLGMDAGGLPRDVRDHSVTLLGRRVRPLLAAGAATNPHNTAAAPAAAPLRGTA